MNIREASEADILAEIAKFQRAQKRYPAKSEIHARIGEQLAPLFAEMMRRAFEVSAQAKEKGYATQAGKFKLRFVTVTYDAKGKSTVTPRTEWLSLPEAREILAS